MVFRMLLHAHNSEHHSGLWGSHWWPLYALGAIGAVIAAPYLLPMVGVGDVETAENAITIMHTHDGTPGAGGGLAGFLNSGITHIPLVGNALAAGGWASIATTGVIGIGGMLLANWMEKREDPSRFRWSKIIRYSALATSALLALPAILTGVSIGLTFLVSILPVSFSVVNATIGGLYATIGAADMAVAGTSSTGLMAFALPHLLSCGAALVPVSLAYAMGKEHPKNHIQSTTAALQMPQKSLQASVSAV